MTRFDLHGKVAVVTSGGSGIGAAIGRAFVEQGARLVVADVNNAGIGLVGSIQETEANDWDKLLAVNVTGVFNGSRVAVDQMLRQVPTRGAIIKIASEGG